MARQQDIKITIPVQVGQAQIIGTLPAGNVVPRELAPPVVLEPGHCCGGRGPGRDVQIAVTINIRDRECVGADQGRIDRMDSGEGGPFEPKNPLSVAPRRDQVVVAIAVNIGHHDVGRARLIRCQGELPILRGVFAGLGTKKI